MCYYYKFSLRHIAIIICCAILFDKQVRCNDYSNVSNNDTTVLYKYKNVFIILNGLKTIFNRNNGTTISKFPPVLEYLLQRVQSMNSNYVYEDLSRPPTYDSADFNKTRVPTTSTTSTATTLRTKETTREPSSTLSIDDDTSFIDDANGFKVTTIKPYQYSTESLALEYYDREPPKPDSNDINAEITQERIPITTRA